jgi:hypothetical protein
MLEGDARDANAARGTVGNASLVGFIARCGESLPEYPRSAPLNACSRDSHLSGNSWPTLPRTKKIVWEKHRCRHAGLRRDGWEFASVGLVFPTL